MGLFFDDKKEETANLPTQSVQQSNGFLGTAGIMVIGFLIGVLTWILKPLFTWLFNFKDISRDLAITKMVVIAIIFIGGPLTLYMYVPFVRDMVSLKDTRTLNYSKYGTRITFPDRVYFVPEGVRRGLTDGGRTFITYAGYTKKFAQKMGGGTCQLIPRSHGMALASIHPPLQAEGFESEVEYPVITGIYELPIAEYFYRKITTPSYWFRSKAYMREIRIQYQKTASWGEFLDDWNSIESFPDGNKPFEVKALAREHAVICF
jgi:hypothetical protein